ncbi:hypothetical protein VULLAG_LOCUS11340 [Vulpes lagopus]
MKSWQLIAVVGDALQDIKTDCNTCVEIEDRKGCYDQNAVDRVAHKQETFVSHTSGSWKSEIKAPMDLVSRQQMNCEREQLRNFDESANSARDVLLSNWKGNQRHKCDGIKHPYSHGFSIGSLKWIMATKLEK